MPHQAGLSELIAAAQQLEVEDAYAAGAVGYMTAVLVQTTLPHSAKAATGSMFHRQNGDHHLILTDALGVGLPYGTYPRLILLWLCTEAVRIQSRTLPLGNSLSEWMRALDVIPAGGPKGTIRRLHDQTIRLFSATIGYRVDYAGRPAKGSLRHVADDFALFWEPRRVDQSTLWPSYVALSERFYADVVGRAVPVDVRAIRLLKGSSLRLDLYTWLTYRMLTLRRPTEIPWAALALQFGSEFRQLRDFKAAAIEHLRRVLAVYPARVEETPRGLKLFPSSPHVQERPSRRRALSVQRPSSSTPPAQHLPEPRSANSAGEPSGASPEQPGSVRRPRWCGQCMETTRRREDPATGADLGRCPDCHPEPLLISG